MKCYKCGNKLYYRNQVGNDKWISPDLRDTTVDLYCLVCNDKPTAE